MLGFTCLRSLADSNSICELQPLNFRKPAEMAKGRKYDYRVLQDASGWRAEITRRMTSRKTVVSKSQGGFTTESEAQEWRRAELENFNRGLR